VIGTFILLFAGYLDGCDGEIARLRLEASKLGAWLDTMCDEATTVVSIMCVGLHVYNTHGHAWIAYSVIIASGFAILSVYCVYYFLLASGSSNSQDYPTSGGIIEFLKLFVRREMINLGSVGFALAGAMEVLYAGLVLGGLVTCAVLVPQHLALRRSRRQGNAALTVPSSS
jgi:phosphatidylglycerophosphate synthase